MIFACTAASAATLIAAAIFLIEGDGIPSRWLPRAQALLRYEAYDKAAVFPDSHCFLDRTSDIRDFKPAFCLPTVSGRPRVLLLGDSYAGDSWRGIASIMGGSNIGIIAGAGCRPTLNDKLDDKARCRAMHIAIPQAIRVWKPELIIVAGHWHDNDLRLLPAFADSLKETGARILVAGPRPDYTRSIPFLLAKRIHDPKFILDSYLNSDRKLLDDRFQHAAVEMGVNYVSLLQELCPPLRPSCRTLATADIPMFFDGGHVTAEGSQIVAAAFVGADPALRPR